MHLLAHAMATRFRLDDRFVEQVGEIIGMNIRAQDHIPAATSIPAVRTTEWDELFATETYAAASAITRLGEDFDSIDKHGPR